MCKASPGESLAGKQRPPLQQAPRYALPSFMPIGAVMRAATPPRASQEAVHCEPWAKPNPASKVQHESHEVLPVSVLYLQVTYGCEIERERERERESRAGRGRGGEHLLVNGACTALRVGNTGGELSDGALGAEG